MFPTCGKQLPLSVDKERPFYFFTGVGIHKIRRCTARNVKRDMFWNKEGKWI